MKKLIIVSCISLIFIAAELYGGWLSGSIAVFSDAAHLGSDIFGFAISMIALKLSHISKSDTLSYGWHRAEIIGTLISVATMWIMTIWLIYEATMRFFEPPEVQGLTMLIVAIIGLIFNLIQIKILHSGDGHYHLGGEDHHGHDHGHSHSHAHGHGHSHDHEESEDEHDQNHDHGHDHKHDHKHDHGHDHKHDHKHDHGHDHKHDHKHDHGHDHKHDHKHDHGHDHKHDHKHDDGHEHDHSHNHKLDHSHDPKAANGISMHQHSSSPTKCDHNQREEI